MVEGVGSSGFAHLAKRSEDTPAMLATFANSTGSVVHVVDQRKF